MVGKHYGFYEEKSQGDAFPSNSCCTPDRSLDRNTPKCARYGYTRYISEHVSFLIELDFATQTLCRQSICIGLNNLLHCKEQEKILYGVKLNTKTRNL